MPAAAPPGSEPAKSTGGRSDNDLQLLRAKFHASQFRFTSALAAESGKASDGAFRIQVKQTEVLKPTKAPPKTLYETIDDIEDEEGMKYVEIKEPEYDMFGDSTDEDEPLEEWDPAFIVETLKKENQRWKDAVMEEDPLTDKQELEEIKKRRMKDTKEKEKKNELKPVTFGPNPTSKESTPVATPSPSQESVHSPAFSPGALPSSEPLIPAVHLKHGSQELNTSPSQTQLQAAEKVKNAADPLFDCLENDIVLDDQYLSEITNGIKEGVYYDNAYLTDDLKKKLLEIDANKDTVEAQLVERALATPMKTDETANKIVEALTDKEVIFKTVDVEDTKLLTEYFNGTRKADDEVIAALGRVIDKVLDRAPEIYPNKEELAPFLRNRGTAKSHLLDAMLSKKGGWLSNFYGSAYSAALALYSGVEAVGQGLVAAKDVAEQGATLVRDYAGTTADVVNRGYKNINEFAGQTATVARDVALKGSEMASKVSDAASYGTEQALRVASVTAIFAGKVSSVVSSASSSLSGSTSSTSVTSTVSQAGSIDSTATPSSSMTTTGTTENTSAATSSSGNTSTLSSSTATSNPTAAVGASKDENKSIEEEEKAPKRNVLADSPVPLTFNGFLPLSPPPPKSPTPASTGEESFLTTVWKTLSKVLMSAYAGNAESGETSKEEEPPKDGDKKDPK